MQELRLINGKNIKRGKLEGFHLMSQAGRILSHYYTRDELIRIVLKSYNKWKY